MISKKKLEEIRNYLIKAENPLFFFDDDADGLCSYLLLNKFIDFRGNGVVIKSSPILDVDYLSKVSEYGPDIIFVLDKPKLSQEFVDAVNVPIIYIDHHNPQDLKGVHYYNPRIENSSDGRCVTYWCYKIVKQDLWIAVVGCVSDWQVPDFLKKFEKEQSNLLIRNPLKSQISGTSKPSEILKKPNELLFDTRLGELCRIFSFLLKGKTSDVKRRISALSKITGPLEILDCESARGKFLFREALKVRKRYDELLSMALTIRPSGKLHLFTYPTCKLSLTSDLSNELLHRFPDRIILVGREKGGYYRLSFRSNNIILPGILQKALDGVEGYSGGHEYACGGNIAVRDFDKFVNQLENLISK